MHELSPLLRDLLLYYLLILRKRVLDLFICQFALVDLDLALGLKTVDLLKQHPPARFLLFVNGVRLQCLLNLLLNLTELLLPLRHHFLSQMLVIVLQFSDRLQLLNIGVYLQLISFLKILATQTLCQEGRLTVFARF